MRVLPRLGAVRQFKLRRLLFPIAIALTTTIIISLAALNTEAASNIDTVATNKIDKASIVHGENIAYTVTIEDHDTASVAEAAPVPGCSIGNNDLAGTVFRDFNADGILDTNELGFDGTNNEPMTVYAYDDTNTLVMTSTVSITGTYNFPAIFSSYDAVRLEFDGLPAFMDVGYNGAGNGTATQIHTVGTCEANFAVHNSADYCQSNPPIAANCFVTGDPLVAGTPAGLDAFVGFNYQNSGSPNTNSDYVAPTHYASAAQIGSTWGVAYHPTEEKLLLGTFVKRHAGVGPSGIDAIYLNDPFAGSTNASLLTNIGNAAAGSIASNAARGLTGSATDKNYDLTAFDKVGTQGLGDLDLSVDGQTLYVIGLADKSLNTLTLNADNNPNTPISVTGAMTKTIPDPGCNNGEWRPFALKMHESELYIGGVCDASNVTIPGINASGTFSPSFTTNDLTATIYRYDGTNFTPVPGLDRFSLTYPKGYADWGVSSGSDCELFTGWYPWTEQANGTPPVCHDTWQDRVMYPQPILSDIEFDVDGSIIIGFMDRFGHQFGYRQYGLDTGSTQLYNTAVGGDILRAAANGDGSFTLESNGMVGGLTGGANEFYSGEHYNSDESAAGNNIPHAETSHGGLALLPGTGEVVVSAMDPVNTPDSVTAKEWDSGGVIFLSNTTGLKERGYRLYQSSPATGLFGKAAGIGDVELLCRAAPIEIGNYIWLDDDGDGVQSPTETGIGSITVQLWSDPDGIPGNGDEVLIDTTTTDANGQYYFNAEPNSNYYISVDPTQSALDDVTLTQQDYAGNAAHPTSSISSDTHDSDGVLNSSTGTVIIPVTTGAAGENDHTLDIGFKPIEVEEAAALGNFIWLDENNDGMQDAGEHGIPNVVVALTPPADIDLGNGAGNPITTTTDANGGYLFDNLPPADGYVVTVDGTQDALAGEGLTYTVTNSSGSNSPDFGNQDPAGYTVDLSSGEVDLSADFGYNHNTNDEVNGTAGNGGTANASIGNTVWIDSDGDGIEDPDETPVSGVVMTLYDINGNVVTTTTTDEAGHYLFDNLPPSAYSVGVTDSSSASHNILGSDYSQTGDPDHFGMTDTSATNNDNLGDAVVLAPGDVFLNMDFGYQPDGVVLNSVGDTIWYDADADGNGMSQVPVDGGVAVTQGAGDSADATDYGIPGVSVSLIDDLNDNGIWDNGEPVIATDVTDENGQYLFADLADGSYLVWVNDTDGVLTGLDQTYDDNGPLDNLSAVDLDSVGSDAASVDDRDQDFGYSDNPPVGSIGDTVWFDIDSSGGDQTTQGAEPGLEGVTVNLFIDDDGDGAPDDLNGDGIIDASDIIATDITDSNGNYLFENLPLTSYVVEVVTTTLPATVSPIATYESDGDADGLSTTVLLTETAPHNREQDFSYPPASTALNSVGDYVWFDIDRTGDQDATEPGLADVTVNLAMSVPTEDFSNGYGSAADPVWTSGWVEGNDTGDATGGSILINGSNELEFKGATGSPTRTIEREIDLSYGSGDAILEFDLRDVNGGFEPADTFRALVSYDGGATYTSIYAISDPDGVNTTVSLNLTELAGPPTADTVIQFEYVASFNGETLVVDNVSIEKGVASTTTDADGYYLFDGLPDNQYTVSVDTTTLPDYVEQTATGDPESDADSVSVVDLDSAEASATGIHDRIRDFGYPPNDSAGYTLGDYVWFDVDSSGSNQAASTAEPPLAGVTVNLYDGTGALVGTTTTDPDGYYLFTGLMTNTYRVEVATETLPDYVSPVSTYDGSDGAAGDSISTVVLSAANPHGRGEDFSYPPTITPTGTIGDTVWLDLDGDGAQNGGEQGIADVTVQLAYPDGTTITTTTDALGNYIFTDLPISESGETYTVTVITTTLPVGVSQTYDQDAPTTDHTSSTTLTVADPIDLDQDFGYNGNNTLGNLVWMDTDADGVYEPNGADGIANTDDDEPVLGDVTVDIYMDTNGNGVFDSADALVAIATTAATTSTTSGDAGNYLVENLPDGTYFAKVSDDNGIVNGYWHSLGTPNATDNSQNDAYYTVALDPSGADTNPVENLTADFGYYVEPAALGNYVWLDSDADGLQDDGETGINGVEVQLVIDYLDGTSITVTTVTTDDISGNPGWYSFNNLLYDEDYAQGSSSGSATAAQPAYTISVDTNQTAVADYMPTTVNVNSNGNDGEDSDDHTGVTAVPNQGLTDVDARDPETNEQTIASYDFGFMEVPELGQIGNYVWLDEDGDGDQDAGERGIPNVIVNLTDSAGTVYTTTTDTQGGYLFSDLPPGTYTVTVPAQTGADEALEGLNYTTPNPNSGGDFGNQDPTGYAVTIGGDEPLENLSADFGYNYNTPDETNNPDGDNAAFGDRIWIDVDGDGAQDPNEPAVSGAEVTLYHDPDGNGVYDTVYGTTTTDENGYYIFDNLPAGAYVATVTDDSGASHDILNTTNYSQTGDPDHFGTTGTTNDNTTTSPVILAPGDVFLNADFGYQPSGATLGRIGDTVWFDANASGTATQDAGENGIAGVTVALIQDTNGNGVWDVGEPIIATDTTDESGNYLFEGLPLDDNGGDNDADYIVWVNDTDNVLAGLAQTYDQDAPLDNMSATALSSATTEDLDQDFSYTAEGHNSGDGLIGNTIWFDSDNSGGDQATQGSEPGIEGVIVILMDESGITTTTATDENGNYYFGGLDPNRTYTVTVAPENFAAGGVLEGLSESYDPDDGMSNQSVVDLSTTGPINLDQDFSYVGTTPHNLGNLVWLDQNADGVWDGEAGPDGVPGTDDDEPVIGGVTVDLYRDLNGNGVIDAGEPLIGSTVTSSSVVTTSGDVGNYLFTGLPDGDYVLDVTDEAGMLAGYWHSRGTDNVTDNSQADPYAVTINGANNMTADFGYYVDPAAVGNYVWLDANDDGLQDSDEDGINGVEVMLVIEYPDGTTITLTTVTGDNPDTVAVETGWYSFDNLLLDEDYNSAGAGEPAYTLSVDMDQAALAAYEAAKVDVSTATSDRNDSDNHAGTFAEPVQGLTDTNQLSDPTSEQAIAGYDFGVIQTVLIGNRIWFEDDGDGDGTNGNPLPANGLVVTATASNGSIYTATTDSAGLYTITVPANATYTVTVATPDDYVPSTVLVSGADSTPDDNNDQSHNSSGAVVTVVTDDNLDIDFAFTPKTVEIGNYIWLEDDGNGDASDGNPMSVAGIVVTAIDADGIVYTATTDAAGLYTITVPANATYTVTVTPPSGYLPSTVDPAGANNMNSGSGVVVMVTESNDYTIDFGFYEAPALYSIGNLIWIDEETSGVAATPNGVFNPSVDTLAQGVTVTLYRVVGGVIETTPFMTQTTNSDGAYQFVNLAAGDYQVVLPPSNFGTNGPLWDATKSTAYTVSPNSAANGSDEDENHNGTTNLALGVVSNVVALGGMHPMGEGAHGLPVVNGDANTDWTVDFAFYLPDTTAVGLLNAGGSASTLAWWPMVSAAMLTIVTAVLLGRWWRQALAW